MFLRVAHKYVGDEEQAEDCFQEACRKFLDARAVPSDKEEAMRFFCRMLTNSCIDRIRRRTSLRKVETEDDERIESLSRPGEEDPEGCFMVRQAEEAKEKAVAGLVKRMEQLPPFQRQLLQWTFFREPPLSLKEIGRRKRMPVSTVHSRMRNALESLRSLSEDLREEWKKW